MVCSVTSSRLKSTEFEKVSNGQGADAHGVSGKLACQGGKRALIAPNIDVVDTDGWCKRETEFAVKARLQALKTT